MQKLIPVTIIINRGINHDNNADVKSSRMAI